MTMSSNSNSKEQLPVAVSHDNIGSVFLSKQNYDASLAEYRKSLSIRKAVFGSQHPDVATCHGQIGRVLQAKGAYEEALVEFRKEIAIVRETNSIKKNPYLAECHDKIGSILQAQGELDGALEEFQAALAIRESSIETSNNSTRSPINEPQPYPPSPSSPTEHLERKRKMATAAKGTTKSSSPKSKRRALPLPTKKTHDSSSKELSGPPEKVVADIINNDKGNHKLYDVLENKSKEGRLQILEEIEKQYSHADKEYVKNVQPADVRFERGAGGIGHPGNRKYLGLVKKSREKYQDKKTTTAEKNNLTMEIISQVNEYGGRFLSQDEASPDGSMWYICQPKVVRKKVMQALREKQRDGKLKIEKKIPPQDTEEEAIPLDALAAMASRRRSFIRGRPARASKAKEYAKEIRDADVRCERGSGGNNHPGNKQYLRLVTNLRESYQALPMTAKNAKQEIAMAIIEKIEDNGGRFLELEHLFGKGQPKKYYILSKGDARDKVAQALRNKLKASQPATKRADKNLKATANDLRQGKDGTETEATHELKHRVT